MLKIVFNLSFFRFEVEKECFVVVETAKVSKAVQLWERIQGSLEGSKYAVLSPKQDKGFSLPHNLFRAHAPLPIDLNVIEMFFFNDVTFADQFLVREQVHEEAIPIAYKVSEWHIEQRMTGNEGVGTLSATPRISQFILKVITDRSTDIYVFDVFGLKESFRLLGHVMP